MIAVILAAGYATRLYPLTRDVPKPLLEVAGRSIVDRIIDNAEGIADLREIVVVTNHRFVEHFQRWADTRRSSSSRGIRVIDDGSTSNENRLGALSDLKLAVDVLVERGLDQPVLVLAGDNLFDFDLCDLAVFAGERESDCITAHRQDDVEALRRTGVVELSHDNRVLSFAEKPAEPKSTWAVPPVYVYRPETLKVDLPNFLSEENESDAPGSFIPWLIQRKPVYAFSFTGGRYDIGNLASYEAVKRVFEDRLRNE